MKIIFSVLIGLSMMPLLLTGTPPDHRPPFDKSAYKNTLWTQVNPWWLPNKKRQFDQAGPNYAAKRYPESNYDAWKTAMAESRKYGMTGWQVELVLQTPSYGNIFNQIVRGAEEQGAGFKIALMLSMHSCKGVEEDLKLLFKQMDVISDVWRNSPNVYRLDGAPVISVYTATSHPAAEWKIIIDEFEKRYGKAIWLMNFWGKPNIPDKVPELVRAYLPYFDGITAYANWTSENHRKIAVSLLPIMKEYPQKIFELPVHNTFAVHFYHGGIPIFLSEKYRDSWAMIHEFKPDSVVMTNFFDHWENSLVLPCYERQDFILRYAEYQMSLLKKTPFTALKQPELWLTNYIDIIPGRRKLRFEVIGFPIANPVKRVTFHLEICDASGKVLHRFPETVWDLTKLRVATFELSSELYAAERMVLPRLVLNYAKNERTMFWNPPTLLDPSIRTSWMFWARSTVNRITPKDRSLTWLLNSQGPGETADWNALSGQGVFRANILPADYHSVNLMRIMHNGMEFKAIPGRHAISIGRAIDLPNPGGALHYYQLEMEGPEGDRIQTLPIFVSAGNRPGMVRHPFLLEDNKSIVDIEIEKARIPYWYFPCNAEAGEFLTDVSGYAHHGRLQHGDRVWGPFGSLGYTGYFHYHNGDVLFKPEKCFMRDGDQRGFYRFDRNKKDWIVISGGTAFPYASTYEIELRPQKTGQEMGIFGAPNGQISLTIDPEGYLHMLRTGEVEGIAGSKPGPGYKVELKSVKPLKWDKWQHIAVTYDLRMLRLYVDGKLQAESPCRPNPAFETMDHVSVGALCRFLIQPHTFYSGDLRNIRISGRCLSPEEFLRK